MIDLYSLTKEVFMCTVVSKITNGVTSALSCVYDKVTGSYACLGRHVKRISDERLPACIAKVVQQVFDGLPYTVGTLIAVKKLPSFIVLPVVIGYASAHIYEKQIFSETTYKNLWHGMGNAAMFCTLLHTARFVATKNPAFAFSAAIALFCSQVLHLHADNLKPVEPQHAAI